MNSDLNQRMQKTAMYQEQEKQTNTGDWYVVGAHAHPPTTQGTKICIAIYVGH